MTRGVCARVIYERSEKSCPALKMWCGRLARRGTGIASLRSGQALPVRGSGTLPPTAGGTPAPCPSACQFSWFLGACQRTGMSDCFENSRCRCRGGPCGRPRATTRVAPTGEERLLHRHLPEHASCRRASIKRRVPRRTCSCLSSRSTLLDQIFLSFVPSRILNSMLV